MTMVTMVMKLRTDEAYLLGAVTTIPGSDKQIVGLLTELSTEALQRHTTQLPSSSVYGTDNQLAGLPAKAHRLQA